MKKRYKKESKTNFDTCEIRTHDSEETGKLIDSEEPGIAILRLNHSAKVSNCSKFEFF